MKFNLRRVKLSRKAKLGAWGAIAAGAGIAGGLAVIGADPVPILRSAGADLLATLHARSPGDREAGVVTTKHKKPAVAALPSALSERTPAAAPLATPVITVPATVLAPAIAPAIPAVFAPATILPPAVIPASSGFFIPPPIIPLGGCDNCGTNPPPPPQPPPPGPAVPEPATWAMMLTGFWILGAALRRRRREAVQVGGLQPDAATPALR